MNLKLVDTHAHLNFPQLRNELPTILKNAADAKVKKIISVGVGIKNSREEIALAEKFTDANFPKIFVSVGIHPGEIPDELENEIAALEKLAKNEKVVAIGEFGFDFFKNKISAEKQIAAFEAQLKLAEKLKKPAILHLRDADATFEKFLPQLRNLKFVVHCFSGDEKLAKKIIDAGGFVSFGGILTFPNAENLRKVATKIPLQKIFLETDAPFLAPQRFRGKTCEPAHIFEVVTKLAEIKNLPVAEIAQKTTKNAEDFFGI